MVRALVGSALLLSAFGGSAALLAPSLSAAPGGDAMVVQGAMPASFKLAGFDADDCFPALLLDEGPNGLVIGTADPADDRASNELDPVSSGKCMAEVDGELGLI